MSGESVITSLFATLGFKVNTKGLEDFKKGLTETSKSILTVRNVLKSLTFAGIVAMSRAVSQVVADLDNLNKTTGLSIDLIQEWQLVAEKFNVNKQSITNAFSQIAKARADILQGKGNATAWYMLGIDPTEDPETVFNNVLKMVNQIKDPALRSQKLINLGLDANLVNLIGKTRKDYIDYYTTLKPLNDKERKQILDLKNSFNSLKISLSLLKDNFIFIISPIKYLIELGSRLINIFGSIGKKIFESKDAFKGLITLLAFFNPFLAIITAVGFAIEDLFVFMKGGDSIIGELCKKIPELTVVFKVLGGIVQGFFTFVKSALEGIWIIAEKVIQGLGWFFKLMAKSGAWVGEKIGDIIGKHETLQGQKETIDMLKNKGITDQSIIDMATIPHSQQLERDINTINDNRNITNNYNVNGNDTQKMQETIIKTQESLNINETFNHMGR